MFEVPKGMLKCDRPKDHIFCRHEELYRRLRPEDYFRGRSGKKRFSLYSMDLPDVSVVRSKHNGKPEYALYDDVNKVHYVRWGIVSFEVSDIPAQPQNAGVAYNLKCVHKPHKKNYHHSEVQLWDLQDHHIVMTDHVPYEVQKKWQKEMRMALKLHKEPES